MNKEIDLGFGIIYEYITEEDPPGLSVRCDEDGDELLIADSWEEIRQLNEWLNRKYGKELEEETGYGLPENEERKEYFERWIDYLTGDNFTFSDSIFICECCGRAFDDLCIGRKSIRLYLG